MNRAVNADDERTMRGNHCAVGNEDRIIIRLSVRLKCSAAPHFDHEILDMLQLAVKKMVGARNHDHRQVLRPRPVEHVRERNRYRPVRRGSGSYRPARRASPICRRRADQHQPLGRRALRDQRCCNCACTNVPNEKPASATGRPGYCCRMCASSSAMSSVSPRPSSCTPSDSPTPRKLKRTARSRARRMRAPASARPCCPSCRRTADADARPARCRAARLPAASSAHSSVPAGPAIENVSGSAFMCVRRFRSSGARRPCRRPGARR